MKFIKSDNSPQFVSKVTDSFWKAGAYNNSQYIYSLPNTESKIWYENRDGFHSNGNHGGAIENVIENRAGQTSYGINLNEVYLNGIVLSNSSTAYPPTEDNGSNTRTADRGWAEWYNVRDAWQYGTLQFFPEHGDYDSFDWFKINQPYVFTSNGSSSSEERMVGRCCEIIKALKPEVRNWLIENKRVGDVVSYLMRSNLFGYLDPRSHRVVMKSDEWFSQSDKELAQSITLNSIPPKLEVVVLSDSHDLRESNGVPTTSTIRTPELAGFQRVDDTPIRTIVVELRSNKPCKFHWIKSQGECTITFQNPEKSLATITIPFQTDFSVEKATGESLLSNRVEVTAVAHDGEHYSSPVFITEYFTPKAQAKPKMNQIVIYGDDSFVCRINGTELYRGASWNTPLRSAVNWTGNDLIEIDVTNFGGIGGLMAGCWIGEVFHPTDDTWQCSLDKVNWIAPLSTPHASSGWAQYFTPVAFPQPGSNWLWHPQATETSTVYFRKTVGAVVPTPVPQSVPTPEPTPEPTPVPQPVGDFEGRIKALEETVSKLRAALT
jgi:hypothetical protein